MTFEMDTSVNFPKLRESHERQLNILIIGAAGNGKSSLGNTLLKKKAFETSSSKSSVTVDIDSRHGRHKNSVLQVVDCRGVADTRLHTRESQMSLMNCLLRAISMSPEGYCAIILVQCFGSRGRDYDLDSIEFLERIFGSEFVSKYFILAMTHGDNFEREQEDDGLTFDEWCAEQTGDFKELMKKCCNRIIPFNNVTEDVLRRDAQIDQLVDMIDSLPKGGERFTESHFKLAAQTLKAQGESRTNTIRGQGLLKEQCSIMRSMVNELRGETNISKRIMGYKALRWHCEKLGGDIGEKDITTKETQSVASLNDLSHLFETKAVALADNQEGPSMKDIQDKISELDTVAFEGIIGSSRLVAGVVVTVFAGTLAVVTGLKVAAITATVFAGVVIVAQRFR